MKVFELSGTPRSEFGKKESKSLRKSGKIPCNVYGCGVSNMAFAVDEANVRKLIFTPETHLVHLTIGGDTFPSIIKETQFHPVSGNVLHIDFLRIDDKKPITVEIPVKIDGHAEGVKAGGKLSLEMRKLKVNGLYSQIPDRIVIDVTPLGLGKKMSVGDIQIEGLKMMNVSDACVVQVKVTRASAAPVEETAAAAPTEPAEK